MSAIDEAARAPKTGGAVAKRKAPAPAAAPPAKKPKRDAGAEAGEGERAHYGHGGWNAFSGPATAWLEGAVAPAVTCDRMFRVEEDPNLQMLPRQTRAIS